MQLMSIGSTNTQQADLFLCPGLMFELLNGEYQSFREGDVFVTHELPQSVHILTCDYLIQMAPCMINMQKGEVSMMMDISKFMSERITFKMFPYKLNGGAFVVTIMVGDVEVNLTVDTGAPGSICLGKTASSKIKKFKNTGEILKQQGVNGELICSRIVETRVVIAHWNFDDVSVCFNDTDTQGVDGYVGLSFLRAFDILICNEGIGFKSSGLQFQKMHGYIGEC